jgi:hypothetical protein
MVKAPLVQDIEPSVAPSAVLVEPSIAPSAVLVEPPAPAASAAPLLLEKVVAIAPWKKKPKK